MTDAIRARLRPRSAPGRTFQLVCVLSTRSSPLSSHCMSVDGPDPAAHLPPAWQTKACSSSARAPTSTFLCWRWSPSCRSPIFGRTAPSASGSGRLNHIAPFDVSALLLTGHPRCRYVNWPRLTPNDLLSYTGPGHRTTPRGRGSRFLPRSMPSLLPAALTRRLPTWAPLSVSSRTPRSSAHATFADGRASLPSNGSPGAIGHKMSASGSWATAAEPTLGGGGGGVGEALGEMGARRKGRTGRFD